MLNTGVQNVLLQAICLSVDIIDLEKAMAVLAAPPQMVMMSVKHLMCLHCHHHHFLSHILLCLDLGRVIFPNLCLLRDL